MMGPRRLDVHPGHACWVELSVPNPARAGPARRIVKLRGEIYRESDMGEWKNVIVILRTNFSKELVEPGP